MTDKRPMTGREGDGRGEGVWNDKEAKREKIEHQTRE